MDWLNYHHLLYFWHTAREGTVAGAAKRLHLAQPTVSAQIKRLERSLGRDLFERSGRRLVLTEFGKIAFRYADEIFALGGELIDTVKGRPADRRSQFVVGVADVLPKLLTYRFLVPALAKTSDVQVVCHEGKPPELLARLALHEFDVVFSDAPIPPEIDVRAYSHLLGQCSVTVFATEKLARLHRPRFPAALDGAPFLLPIATTMLRRSLDRWFDDNDIRPTIVGEFEDAALLKVFGQAGKGLFFVPSAIETEVRRQYQVQIVGRIDEIKEQFYAISVERRVRHPALRMMSDAARGVFNE